jgi:hypothetical protein
MLSLVDDQSTPPISQLAVRGRLAVFRACGMAAGDQPFLSVVGQAERRRVSPIAVAGDGGADELRPAPQDRVQERSGRPGGPARRRSFVGNLRHRFSKP